MIHTLHSIEKPYKIIGKTTLKNSLIILIIDI